jgi:hypothetical protein
MRRDNLKIISNLLEFLFWISLVATLFIFYVSLRSDEMGFRATIYALVMLGITYGIHFLNQRIKKKLNNNTEGND